MLSVAWFVVAMLMFLIGAEVARSGTLFGALLAIVFFILALFCLLGFRFSLRGFRPSYTIMSDGEKIEHGDE